MKRSALAVQLMKQSGIPSFTPATLGNVPDAIILLRERAKEGGDSRSEWNVPVYDNTPMTKVIDDKANK